MKKIELQINNQSEKIKCILDHQYQDEMVNEVEPFLNRVKRTGYFSRESSNNLYYEEYLSPSADKSIVICHGFTENAEKYKELIYYFYRENCNVFIMDHQGHGKSFRTVEDYSITHVEKFDDYIEDFKAFMVKKVNPDSKGKPIILYAHSMGGAIGGRYIEKYPDDFVKAIFSSPMFEINSGKMPYWISALIADFKIITGHKKDRIFIQEKFNAKENFKDSSAISRERYDYFFKKRINNKYYHNYCGSYSWLKQSILVTRQILRPENLKQVHIPVIIFQAEKDSLVKASGEEKFAKGVNDALLVFVPETKHEIYMAQSKIVSPYLNKIFEFIG